MSLDEISADVVLLDHCSNDELRKLIGAIQQRSLVDLIVMPEMYSEDDMVYYLSRGVADYLPRQLTPRALSARLRALYQRRPDKPPDGLTVGKFQLDPLDRVVRRDGEEIALTPTEFRLLEVLLNRRGRTCSHKSLLNEVWGRDCIDREEYLRVYIRLLRQKLELDPHKPRWLVTVRGVGYRLVNTDSMQKPRPVLGRKRAQTT